MSAQIPPCPPQFKTLQHYLKIATEHDQRDPVISYWCRLYSLQQGLKIDKKSEEALKVLMSLMDWLEKQKKVQADNEAVTNDIAAQAHVENYALKLFLWADEQDRAAVFNKNVVKAFYTAGMLFDVLETFGELSEASAQNKKYAKWKASYIHNCLKNGETPIPGPQGGEEGEEQEFGASGGGIEQPAMPQMGFIHPNDGFPSVPSPFNMDPNSGGQFPGYNPPPSAAPTPTTGAGGLPDIPASQPQLPQVPQAPHVPQGSSTGFVAVPPQPSQAPNPEGSISSGSAVTLSAEQISKAQKYCKWSSSALNYDDIPTAINNLQKALVLLQTGRDS